MSKSLASPSPSAPSSSRSASSPSSAPASSPLSPAELAARRQNAQHSTGPKTPEGKARSRFNALQHGAYASSAAWSEEALRALGEDPAEFRRLRAELRSMPGPEGDPLWDLQSEDLARLSWRRQRLERAWETLAATRRAAEGEAAGLLTPLAPEGERLLRLLEAADRAIDRKTRLLLRLREADERREGQRERFERQRLELLDPVLDAGDAATEESVGNCAGVLRKQDQNRQLERQIDFEVEELGKLLENAERSGEETENKENSEARRQEPGAGIQDSGATTDEKREASSRSAA